MPEDIQSGQEKKNRPAGVIPRYEGLLRFSGVYFLSALILLIVTAPLIEDLEYGILIESVLITLVLFSALLAIGGRRSTLVLGSVLVIPALAGKWVNYFRPDLVPPEIFLGAGVFFIGYVVLHLFTFIFRAPRVNVEILCTAIANYLLLGLLWSFGYLLIARVNPDAFVIIYGAASGRSVERWKQHVFQLCHALHRQLRRHRPRVESCTDVGGTGGHRRHVLHDHGGRTAGHALLFSNTAR